MIDIQHYVYFFSFLILQRAFRHPISIFQKKIKEKLLATIFMRPPCGIPVGLTGLPCVGRELFPKAFLQLHILPNLLIIIQGQLCNVHAKDLSFVGSLWYYAVIGYLYCRYSWTKSFQKMYILYGLKHIDVTDAG